MKRFYPDSLPSFPNEPTPDNFAIHRISDSVGEGVVAQAHFAEGDIVCAFSGYFVEAITQFSLTVGDDLHIHDPYFMGKVLHSCDPSLHCDMTRRQFIAKRAIQPGDIITMDYDQTEPHLFRPFHCSCGAKNCRGFIAGHAAVSYQEDMSVFAANAG
jgi:hypothetical protein